MPGIQNANLTGMHIQNNSRTPATAAQANRCEFKGRRCELDTNSKKTAGCFSGLLKRFLAWLGVRAGAEVGTPRKYSVHTPRQNMDANPITLISITPLEEADYALARDPRACMLDSAITAARHALYARSSCRTRSEWQRQISAYNQPHKKTDVRTIEYWKAEFESLTEFAERNTPSELKRLSEIENTDTAFWVRQKLINVIGRGDQSHALPLTDNQTAFNNAVAAELGRMMNITTAIQDGFSALINDYINPTRHNLDGDMKRLSKTLVNHRRKERQLSLTTPH